MIDLDLFDYEVREGEAFILAYKGNQEACLELPELIDGCKLREISPFAFKEHRELVELKCPDTVVKIGAHAFYNCRNLKAISLCDVCQDIGDGAFKNCFELSKLNVKRKVDNSKLLKGILSDVNNEVTLSLIYPDGEARLVFPYFLYNYEENTPARIVNQITEGSGVQYRECISSSDIAYDAYDRLFHAASFIDLKDSSIRIAINRLSYPYKLLEKDRKKYSDYIDNHLKDYVLELIDKNQDQDLMWILSLKYLKKDDCMDLIEYARLEDKMDALSRLMDYNHSNFQEAKKGRRYEL